ncbi:class 1 fructose-bisphosphatase [candidate division KSB1 bacterium]|nr:class 1 fructose-bisphosphatase [candidate division KSB1 bacterium]
MPDSVVTIDRHILEQQQKYPEATGGFSGLMSSISFAAKIISREVNKAGLVELLGITGQENVHGEVVQKLDVYAHNVIVQMLGTCGYLSAMISEEREDLIPIPEGYPLGKYILTFDPLDGSANIDANVSIGSIFGIYEKLSSGDRGKKEDFMQPGNKLVASGYVIYGSSTMFVYSTGQGVHGFTLDSSIGEFLLSHETIKTPKKGKIYSVNEGNFNSWDDGIKNFIMSLKNPEAAGAKPYSSRYIGSLVADFHRNLLYGGIFLYPGNRRNPRGKLRLLYEANPLSFIIEQAGGYASDGSKRILDIQPESFHQRVPLIIGSEEDVRNCEKFIRESQ